MTESHVITAATPDPILVTGTPRAGVSLIGSIVAASGAFGGYMGRPLHYTRRFLCQNIAIRKTVVRPFIAGLTGERHDGDLLDIPDIRLCRESASKVASTWRSRILKILEDEGYGGGPWFYKCSMAALIWPVWHEAFPQARWVVVRRSDEEIVDACLRSGYMRACQTIPGWYAWLEEHKRRFAEMIEAGLRIFQVWPRRMLEGSLAEAHELIDWLGLTWRRDALAEILAPAMWKSRIYETRGG